MTGAPWKAAVPSAYRALSCWPETAVRFLLCRPSGWSRTGVRIPARAKVRSTSGGGKAVVRAGVEKRPAVRSSGYRCLVYTDPFGLAPCPPDHDCGALTAALATTGAILGGFGGGLFGGGLGLACGPAAPACSVAGASTFSAQGAALGASAGLALGLVFSKSHTVGTVEIQGQKVRVDWNEPRGRRPGDVHIQSKGGEPIYEKLNSPDDLSRLPKSIRGNETIQQLVQKAFDLLGRFQQ